LYSSNLDRLVTNLFFRNFLFVFNDFSYHAKFCTKMDPKQNDSVKKADLEKIKNIRYIKLRDFTKKNNYTRKKK
jgi:hypothetical protein